MSSIKLYLDTRKPRKDGSCPLKLSVSHKGYFQIGLDVYLSPEQWADGKVQTHGNLNEQKRLQRYVEARFSAAQNICGRWDDLVE